MEKTVNELHAMLKLHEQTLPKSNAPALNAIQADKVQKGNKHKKSHTQKGAKGQNQGKGKFVPKPKIPPPPKRENPAKDSIYHECGEIGHWKRNYPQYLAELMKKKKNTTSGAGGSEIVLNNCHYAPSITRGVNSVSCLYEDGFVNRFIDNTIQFFRNNVVYFCAIPRDGIFEIDLSNSLTNESSVLLLAIKEPSLTWTLLSCGIVDLDILVRSALRSCNMMDFSVHLTLHHSKNASLVCLERWQGNLTHIKWKGPKTYLD
nr:zinc finger, CCHC-type [Tanacetum cinerariifolium]